jgi:hypothetical protein
MGSFELDEELHLFEPGLMSIPADIADEVPDAGAYFLSWATSTLPADQAREIEAAVNGRRCQNGWFPLESLDNIGLMDFRAGPLTFLARMTANDSVIMEVWASLGLQGDGKRQVEATTNHLLFQQGHAAAATWARAVRPQANLSLDFLSEYLSRNWEEGVGSILTKDFLKAVRKWSR